MLSIEALDSLVSSIGSQPSSSANEASHDFDLLEDEDLPPSQPTFMGLFPQALFKSLLHKAIITAQLDSQAPMPVAPTTSKGALNLLFAEPSRLVDIIPNPPPHCS